MLQLMVSLHANNPDVITRLQWRRVEFRVLNRCVADTLRVVRHDRKIMQRVQLFYLPLHLE